MAEPPSKRARRTDSAAMWDKEETATTRSSKPPEDSREARKKDTERDGRHNDGSKRRVEDHRHRSRSRERNERHTERSKSKERTYRDRDRVRGEGRDYDRDGHSRRDRDRSRSRSRDRNRPLRGSRSDYTHHRSRSRSPARNGISKPTRTRSPPKGPRPSRDRPVLRDREKDEDTRSSKPGIAEPDAMQVDPKKVVNGHNSNPEAQISDEEGEDALLRKMMGFSNFKSTQNTKVPGNNIYGVRKEKKTEYRQYMNRVGGFNRPLSPSR